MPTPLPALSTLPPLYDRWVTALLGAPAPAEPLATCSDCAMCGVAAHTGGPPARILEPVAFDPDARCCTYHPHVWNFLAGAALLDRSPAGAVARASVLARLEAGGATPLGLTRSRRYAGLAELGAGSFGRARSLVCPHYVVEGAQCAIWRHRESTCATWFCKHEHGAVAKRFWERLHTLLRTSEHAVARHVVLALDPGPEALAALFPLADARSQALTLAEFEELRDPARERSLWGRWAGREIAFYEEAAQLVAPLEWSDVLRLGGAALALDVALVRSAQAELDDEAPPAKLRVTEFSVAPSGAPGEGTVLLGTYSGLDPLSVPLQLLECLPYFDGRPTAEAIAAVEASLGISIEVALVRRLYEFGVLEAVN